MAKKRVSKKKAAPPADRQHRAEYSIADGVSQSLLGGWCNCRQWAEHHINGWRCKAPRRAIEFGSMFHGLLEAWHRSAEQQTDPIGLFTTFSRKWIADAAARGDDLQAVEKDVGMASALWAGYLMRWHKDDAAKEWIAVEGTFDVRWHGYRLRGKVDGLYGLKGRNYLLETKTMGRIDQETIGLALRFDWQLMYYLTAMEIATGKKVRGATYNIIRRPQIDVKKDETIGAYLERLRADVAARPEWYFLRYELPFDDDQVEAGQRELVTKLDEFGCWLDNGLITWRNQAACRGRWNCEYLELCATGATDGYTREGKMFTELEEEGK